MSKDVTGKIILEVERLATEALSARIALHLKCSMCVPELLNLFPGHGLLFIFWENLICSGYSVIS